MHVYRPAKNLRIILYNSQRQSALMCIVLNGALEKRVEKQEIVYYEKYS